MSSILIMISFFNEDPIKVVVELDWMHFVGNVEIFAFGRIEWHKPFAWPIRQEYQVLL